MNEHEDRFEGELRAALGRLADEAPAPPQADRVLRRLRRRTILRATFGAAAAAIVAVAAISTAWLVQPTAPDGAGQGVGPAVANRSTVEPLAPGADARQVEAALAQYLGSVGARNSVVVSKMPGDGLSFAMPGGSDVSTDAMSRDLERMFTNFERVDVAMRNGKAALVLLRPERSHG